MASANPAFWEIPVEPRKLEAFSTGCALWKPTARTVGTATRDKQKRELVDALLRLIQDELTDRQRECIQLYFFEGRSQQEIADALGIGRRVVSQHLFGIRRNGRRVGGAMKRIRKLCERYGVHI
jgi:RNA polymerase sigma factor (sigma-70 family)